MSPVNVKLPFKVYKRGHRLGGGSYGTVYGWGPWVVKIGEVGIWEANKLRKAYDRLPDMFAEFLHFRRTHDHETGVLFMAKIPGRPLSRTPRGPRRQALQRQVKDRLRAHGIEHYDLHPNNIMRRYSRLYVVDTDSISLTDRPVK